MEERTYSNINITFKSVYWICGRCKANQDKIRQVFFMTFADLCCQVWVLQETNINILQKRSSPVNQLSKFTSYMHLFLNWWMNYDMIFIIANSHCIRISGIGNYMFSTYMLTSSIFLTDFHLHFKKIIMLDTLQEVHLKHISYWFTLGFLCFSFLKKVLSL